MCNLAHRVYYQLQKLEELSNHYFRVVVEQGLAPGSREGLSGYSCLLYKQEDLSLDPQQLYKKPGMMACSVKQVLAGVSVETGSSWCSLGSQSSQLVSMRFSEELYLKKSSGTQ